MGNKPYLASTLLIKGAQTSRNAAQSLHTCPCISSRPLRHQTRVRGSSAGQATKGEIGKKKKSYTFNLKCKSATQKQRKGSVLFTTFKRAAMLNES